LENWWPCQGALVFNFSQHGLARGGLGEHFEKKLGQGKSLSGIFVKLMALPRGIIFPTFPNMVWQGVVLGTIFGKVLPRRKP